MNITKSRSRPAADVCKN